MLGLNRLIDRGEFKLYTIALAAMMITNYYIGGMVCIFILFYYPILYFSRTEKKGAAACARTVSYTHLDVYKRQDQNSNAESPLPTGRGACSGI